MPIESTKNPLVRRFRAAAEGASQGLMVAEGTRLVGEALDAGAEFLEVAYSPRLETRAGGPALLERIRDAGIHLSQCTDRVMERLSHLNSHQGIAVILKRPAADFDRVLGHARETPLVVVAAGVQEPGNLGALVRNCEAFRATGVVVIGGADPFRDKALRGSAGSAFRVPCVRTPTPDAFVEFAKRSGLDVLVADGAGDTDCWQADLRRPTALVFGAEGAGVPREVQAIAHTRVRIPIAQPVESLNVAVAAGVLLFEAQRQRSS